MGTGTSTGTGTGTPTVDCEHDVVNQLVAAADLTLVDATVRLLHVLDEQVPLPPPRYPLNGVTLVRYVHHVADRQRVGV